MEIITNSSLIMDISLVELDNTKQAVCGSISSVSQNELVV